MKFVKENNSVFLIGEISDSVSFDIIENYGLSLHPVQVDRLECNTFQYSQSSSRNTRLHSKKTQYLLECMHHLNFDQVIKGINPRSIGIYVNGSANYHLLPVKFVEDQSIHELLRAGLNPIDSLRHNIGVIPGHLAIFHELYGPTFALSSLSPRQIFTKAVLDLREGITDLAVLGYINTYEDQIVLSWHKQLSRGRTLVEAAGVVLLDRDNIDEFKTYSSVENKYFGYLENLISKNWVVNS